MSTQSAIVVGAGIVGAACSERLASEGFNVTIIDKHHPGSGATAEGMGHLVVMDDSPAQISLTNYSRQIWSEMAKTMSERVEYQGCGTIWVASNNEEMEEVERKHELYKENQIETEIIDQAKLQQLEPNLATDLVGGLRVGGDSVLYAPYATQWLLDRAKEFDATTHFGVGVSSITDHAVNLSNGNTISADVVVNAAGLGASELTPELDIRSKKGHLLITDRYPGFINHQIVELGYLHNAHAKTEDSVAFNLQPRATGQILIGSARQFDQFTREIDKLLVEKMVTCALRFAPKLKDLIAIRTWVGFRPATPDNLPYIGIWPKTPGLWICAGHEGLGISTSVGSAHLLIDQIMQRTPSIKPEPFFPSRLEGKVYAA